MGPQRWAGKHRITGQKGQKMMLFIDNDLAGLTHLKPALEQIGYTVAFCQDANVAVDFASSIRPDIIFMEANLQDISGFEICARLKKTTFLASTPVIFLTALNDESSKAMGRALGAIDWLVKPATSDKVIDSLSKALHPLLARRNSPGLGTNLITDPLTGLYTKHYMKDRLKEEVERAKKYHYSLGCILIDIDNFAEINSVYGSIAGDTLLIELASLLKHNLRPVDTLARVGPDEFFIVLTEHSIPSSIVVSKRLKQMIEAKLNWKGLPRGASVTCSFGCCLHAISEDPSVVIDKMKISLDDAKRNAPGRIHLLTN